MKPFTKYNKILDFINDKHDLYFKDYSITINSRLENEPKMEFLWDDQILNVLGIKCLNPNKINILLMLYKYSTTCVETTSSDCGFITYGEIIRSLT